MMGKHKNFMDDDKGCYLSDLKNGILSPYPTTVRHSVCLQNIVEVNHSVNQWLYKRWVENATTERELSILHQEMKQTILEYSENSQLEVNFVHVDPIISNDNRQDILSCKY